MTAEQTIADMIAFVWEDFRHDHPYNQFYVLELGSESVAPQKLFTQTPESSLLFGAEDPKDQLHCSRRGEIAIQKRALRHKN
jgi:hypothetical protein